MEKNTGHNINEQLLLQQVAEGDWKAYADLFNHYLPKLSQFIYPFANRSKENTEEVIQEVFLKIWEKKEMLVSIRSFDSYLFRMAKNKVIDLLRQEQSKSKLHISYSSLRGTSHTEPEEKIIYEEYSEIAGKAISGLSPKLQQVFLMSTQDEMSLDEIAGELGLPKETVKKRLYLANTSIKDYLKKNAQWLSIILFWIFK